MTSSWTPIATVVLAATLAGAAPVRADVTGSYDGTLTPKKSTETMEVSAVFSQTDRTLAGTVALAPDLETFGGAYLVAGKATKKRVKVKGTGPGGALLKFNGKITDGALRGKLKVKAPGAKLRGVLALTLNPPLADGTPCDGVYTANQTFFDDQVQGQALTACTSCHEPDLQAAATRFRVDLVNPLATARLIASLVDAADPPASRILRKPLNVLPHGGGVQITPGSNEEQILTQWVGLVAAAGCN